MLALLLMQSHRAVLASLCLCSVWWEAPHLLLSKLRPKARGEQPAVLLRPGGLPSLHRGKLALAKLKLRGARKRDISFINLFASA